MVDWPIPAYYMKDRPVRNSTILRQRVKDQVFGAHNKFSRKLRKPNKAYPAGTKPLFISQQTRLAILYIPTTRKPYHKEEKYTTFSWHSMPAKQLSLTYLQPEQWIQTKSQLRAALTASGCPRILSSNGPVFFYHLVFGRIRSSSKAYVPVPLNQIIPSEYKELRLRKVTRSPQHCNKDMGARNRWCEM